jgi:hypothetical protein
MKSSPQTLKLGNISRGSEKRPKNSYARRKASFKKAGGQNFSFG